MTRVDALKDAARSGAGAVLLTSPVARRYATGFNASAGVVLVTGGEGFFITDFRYIESARAQVKGFTVLLSTRENTALKQVAEILKTRGITQVGYEADTVTAEALEKLNKELEVSLIPAQERIHALRLNKSADEVAAIKAAQRIAERALKEVIEGVLRPGITERQLCAEIIYRIHLYGADGVSFPPIVVSGPNSSLPHGEPGDRVLRRGDCVTIDIGAQKDGYCSDMTRTYVLGEASDEVRRVYDTVLRAQLSGIAAVRAGKTGAQIDEAARSVIRDAGYGEFFGHGFGHGVGLEVHERPTLSPGKDDPLTPGAVITAEPGIYLPGKFGVRIEDLLLVTEDGCENLTEMTKELTVIE
ncbi:MAG: Xaa-Pro peptidase family protein [Oscillospiraceae bacterium]|jgi:Xaa-Pro aminopeptidase|nr:Xaa-Pro peptidase family protein [Oscillospiraceae bacterium]